MELDKKELEKIRGKYNKILIQLPDGLKPKFKEIIEEIKKYVDGEIWIWFNSNYGACDIPNVDFDLIINIGHSKLFYSYFPSKDRDKIIK